MPPASYTTETATLSVVARFYPRLRRPILCFQNLPRFAAIATITSHPVRRYHRGKTVVTEVI